MGNDSNILIEKNHIAVFISLSQSAHHFEGVFQALADRGWSACAETIQTGIPIRLTSRMLRQAKVIVHADCTGINAVTIHNTPIEPTQPTQPTQPILLQMDGILEYANTFLNTNTGNHFLQPAPADAVLASGVHDRSILRAMGNRAIATGLPRLDGFVDRVRTQRVDSCQGILVASANQPAFTPGARSRLIASFKHIKNHAAKQNLPIRWRIEPTIACELGVENDETELAESLAQVRCVLTSASTLAIESMIANKPTAIIHPHPWPLWIPCAWRYDTDATDGVAQDQATINALQGKDRRANAAAADSIAKILAQTTPIATRSLNELLSALLNPSAELMAIQERIVQRYTRPNPAKRVARVIERVASSSTLHPEPNQPSARIPEPKGQLIEAFDAMRKDQSSKITIIASRAPTPELATLAEHRFDQIERFIVLAEPGNSTLLGIPAVSYAHIEKLISPKNPVLIAPQGDCELIVASRALRSSGIHPLVCPDPEAIEHIDAVIDDAQAIIAQGQEGLVRTTLKEPSIEGAKHCSRDQILRGNRPAMLILKGDEIDFDICRRSCAWRDEGTIVRSLRWSDAELSSPERFASMVQALNNQPYAIYGGGLHTQRLLKYAPLTHLPRMILDDHAPDGMFGTIPVIHPQSLHEKEVGTVILSSLTHEPTLWAQSAHLRQRGIRVLGLYGAGVVGVVGSEIEP